MPVAAPPPQRVCLCPGTIGGGGIGMVMLGLAEALRARGAEVDIVLAGEPPPAPGSSRSLPEGVRLVHLSTRARGGLWPMVRYLRRARPGLLISARDHVNLMALAAHRLSGLGSRCRLVWSFHTFRSGQLADMSRTERLADRLALRLIRAPFARVAVSDGVAEDLARAAGIERSLVGVIDNPGWTPARQQAALAPCPHPWLSARPPHWCPPHWPGAGTGGPYGTLPARADMDPAALIPGRVARDLTGPRMTGPAAAAPESLAPGILAPELPATGTRGPDMEHPDGAQEAPANGRTGNARNGHGMAGTGVKDTDGPVILGAGRLVAQKDFATLIAAFALLRRSLPGARLLILGEGPGRAALEAQITAAGLEGVAVLAGHADNAPCHMARADLFVLSSLWEGQPMALIEALGCGCPVVATDCPTGPAEILRGGLAPLVPPGDAAALAAAMAEVLARPPDPAPLVARAACYGSAAAAAAWLELAG